MRGSAWLLTIAAGCGPVGMIAPAATSETGAGGGSTSTASMSASATAGMTSTAGTADASSTLAPGETSSSNEGALFIPEIDGGANECDLLEEDCPRGMKCMPWANDGGNSWNALRCSPIARDPAQIGEPCTVEGSAVSGLDDCVLHSMCWDVDPDTNIGECVGFCTGSRANPECPEGFTCVIQSEGVLILCLFYCDPLLQDCARGEACYPTDGLFECTDDNSGDAGAIGDPCAAIDVCDPGLFCANADAVTGCAGESCCAPFCDTSDPNASTECDAVLPGTACVPWYERDQSPPGYANVGACVVPQ